MIIQISFSNFAANLEKYVNKHHFLRIIQIKG